MKNLKVKVLVYLACLVCMQVNEHSGHVRWSSAFAAAQGEFSAEVSSNNLSSGDSFQLTLRFKGISEDNFKGPLLPKGFRILGQSKNSSFQMINGSSSSETSFTYEVLVEASPGNNKVTLGPFEVDDDGKRFRSNSIELQITPEKSIGAGSEGANSSSGPFEVNAVFSPSTVYVGQQAFLIVNLESPESNNRIQYREVNIPEIVGVQSEDFGKPQVNTTLENGVRVSAVRIVKKLTPLKAGLFSIEGVRAVADVLIPMRSTGEDPFLDAFRGQFQRSTKAKQSPPLKLEVKSLPTEGRPNNFNGLVGDTSWKVTYPVSRDLPIKAGESHTITVTVTSTGELSGIRLAAPQVSNNIKTYADETQVRTELQNNQLVSIKEFKFATVFTAPGKANILPIQLTYFSPTSKNYEMLEHQFPELTISEGGNSANSNSAAKPSSQEENINDRGEKRDVLIENAAIDIFPLRINPKEFESTDAWPWWTTGLPASLFTIYLLLEIFAAAKKRLPGYENVTRKRSALPRALKDLNSLEDRKKNLKMTTSEFSTAQLTIVKEYLTAKFEKNFAKKTSNEICVSVAQEISVKRKTPAGSDNKGFEENFSALIHELERAAYAAGSSQAGQGDLLAENSPAQAVTRTVNILKNLDKLI